VQKRSWLLVMLRLLVVIGLRLIIVVQRNTSRANAESSQLGRSQRAVGVGDGQEDKDIGEFLERLIPLAVNNLLVTSHNRKALIHHIQTLISAPTCGKDTPEHLQDAGVGSRSRWGTTTVGSVRRSSSRSSRRTSTRSP
jgi:preprotein translocase subunit SecG